MLLFLWILQIKCRIISLNDEQSDRSLRIVLTKCKMYDVDDFNKFKIYFKYDKNELFESAKESVLGHYLYNISTIFNIFFKCFSISFTHIAGQTERESHRNRSNLALRHSVLRFPPRFFRFTWPSSQSEEKINIHRLRVGVRTHKPTHLQADATPLPRRSLVYYEYKGLKIS